MVWHGPDPAAAGPADSTACAADSTLLLDEAYNVVQDSEEDHGHEAIAELLVQMENHRDEFVVFAAGYPSQMDEFLEANPGLRSRFSGRVDFPDYTNDELARIFELMARQQGYELVPDLQQALPDTIRRVPRGRGCSPTAAPPAHCWRPRSACSPPASPPSSSRIRAPWPCWSRRTCPATPESGRPTTAVRAAASTI